MVDDDLVTSKGVIKLYDKRSTKQSKPGGVSGRARSKANIQLALMPVA